MALSDTCAHRSSGVRSNKNPEMLCCLELSSVLLLKQGGSGPTGVLSPTAVYGFKASCMGRRALKQHIKQELIICQPE